MWFSLNTRAHFGEKLGCQVAEAIVPDCWKCSSVAVEGMCGVELSTTYVYIKLYVYTPTLAFNFSLVEKLKAAGVGVECRGRLVSALLCGDDAVLYAEDEEGMRVSLGVLSKWCKQWAVEINVDKCGVMHMRRTGGKFHVDSKRIKVVEEYKYLGCVINEQLVSRRMMEERAKAGARALSEWLRKCRVAVGEMRRETFVKLMEMLVGLLLMYGAEVWGGGGQLGPVEGCRCELPGSSWG